MKTSGRTGAFRHEAFLYGSEEEFVARAVAFIRDGVETGDAVMVAVGAAKIDRLRTDLGGDADSAVFVDMAQLGRNPARIIPAWREFVSEHGGPDRCPRGIGEPVWPGRTGAELVECQLHERLLNVAFADGPPWWLLCPYDQTALDGEVLAATCQSHPLLSREGVQLESADYCGLDEASAPISEPLPEPPAYASSLSFDVGLLGQVRRLVTGRAARAGLDAGRVQEAVLAVHEVASNSVRHGGGRGTLRVWQSADSLICEIRDAGRIHDPLVGRTRPGPEQTGGRGLWLVNQLCDLVQLRTLPTATVVRLHLHG